MVIKDELPESEIVTGLEFIFRFPKIGVSCHRWRFPNITGQQLAALARHKRNEPSGIFRRVVGGLFVPTLPPAHTVFIVDGHTYYYYADVYYVWDNSHTAYRVVNAPEVVGDYRPGDIVDTLPDGAYTVTIDGKQYYRYADVYFMQAIQGDRIVYIVVTP